MTSHRIDPPHESLELGGSIWFQAGAQTLGGAARIALLAAIGETGSITSAAKAIGMSYKGAWDAIDTMNNLAGEPLVVRSTGGKGGGGTTLTPRAVKLIDTFRAVEREHRRFLERAGAAIEGFATEWDLIGRIGVRTSARNQLYGTVSAITRGSVNDEVSLALPGGHTIVAVLTHESTETLGLVTGAPAFALIKASWVVLLVENDNGAPLQLSARNQLRGTVQSVKRGAINAEVSLVLDGGTVITAVVTNESVDTLKLVEGGIAVAAFKASSVILGVKD
ncbi:molybdenum-pterin binding domain protein [Paraburkholderia fungorum]|uniref:Molybdenum-pterin binding domain protein n=1 Tax=Paraburkholderia fungorum TaxID=134537 RepID=A0AAU8TNL2_9BURK|nr:TOBE domain-containing protein [Paraburkholderia fungorum]AJZ62780.1 molybdenum-pterin binding domain protein [Paraburkholderia fungorum]MBB5540528.1 molybdate transport system regulatory protein [Paraburkholderia fungorum]PNE53340.1 molybdenum-dependent transcriptional regulator [Paraburkholderia fungorum]